MPKPKEVEGEEPETAIADPAKAIKPWREDAIVTHDDDYTAELNRRVREQVGSKHKRSATHVSDILMCLRKGWGRLHVAEEDQKQVDDDTLLTWAGGLQFEKLVSIGDIQDSMAYCSKCHAVGNAGLSDDGTAERECCPVCGTRYLIITPDYVVDGILHEVKQTRKSSKQGPEGAPWWIDQLRSYKLFKEISGVDTPYSVLVANWLMGDYGSRKKGEQPRPPRSQLDAYQVRFEEPSGAGLEDYWLPELMRRKAIVEGPEMPPLNGMGDGDELSPAYDWECSSCSVGLALKCPMYIWDENGNVVEPLDKQVIEEVQLENAVESSGVPAPNDSSGIEGNS